MEYGSKAFKARAKSLGVEIIERPNGHIQLKGTLMVNYYPHSKSRSAYVNGTTQKLKGVTAEQALAMCNQLPTATKKDRRRRSYRNDRKRLLKKDPHCHWCRCELTLETSTLEHIIPLAAGGLDNSNNHTLACKPCNEARAEAVDFAEDHDCQVLKHDYDRLQDY